MNKSIINGMILSAGLSGRMNSFKPLADYEGRSFLVNIILKLEVICDKVFIITGHKADILERSVINYLTKNHQNKLLAKLKFVYNDLFQKGMFTSLQKGISAAQNCDWILYHFVDQPGLPEIFYLEFIKQADSDYNWIQPINKGQKGHPILLGKNLFELIAKSSPESNLRKISKSSNVKKKYWDCNYAEIFQDIDTDQDYINL